MSLGFIASNTTVVELDTNRSIFAGSGTIYSVHAANATASPVTVIGRNTADTKDELVLRVPANATASKEVAFLVGAGFVLETVGSGVFATVSHSSVAGSV